MSQTKRFVRVLGILLHLSVLLRLGTHAAIMCLEMRWHERIEPLPFRFLDNVGRGNGTRDIFLDDHFRRVLEAFHYRILQLVESADETDTDAAHARCRLHEDRRHAGAEDTDKLFLSKPSFAERDRDGRRNLEA